MTKKENGSKVTHHQYVGLMLLLLTITGPTGSTERDMETFGTRTALNDYDGRFPYIQYAASLLANLNGDASAIFVGKGNKDDEEDDDDEEESLESYEDALTTSTSIQGKTDSEVLSETHDCLSATEVLPFALQFMDFKTMVRARRVNSAWRDRVETVVTFNPSISAFFVRRGTESVLYGNSPSVSPLRTTRNLGASSLASDTHALRRTLQWQCMACSFWNATGRPHCANPSCCQPSSEVEPSVHRLFVGQLRKEGTADVLAWMTRMVAQDVEVVHIESHTNPSQGGRGKGCAWMYLATAGDAKRVLALHRRVYLDVDEVGNEGMYVCGDSEDEKDLMTYYAAQRSAMPDRPSVLPRNSLVVEEPSRTGRGAGRTAGHHHQSYNRAAPYQHQNPYQPRQQPTMSNYVRPPPPIPPQPYGMYNYQGGAMHPTAPTSYSHHYGCQCTMCVPSIHSYPTSCPCADCCASTTVPATYNYSYYPAQAPTYSY